MQKFEADSIDKRILKSMGQNSDLSLSELQKKTGILSLSALSRRLNRMRKFGVITGQKINIDHAKLGYEFMTITFIKARYGPGYADIVAEKIRKINGVVSLTFLLGDIDFVAYVICKSRDEYAKVFEQFTKIEEIERTDSRTVLRTYTANSAGFLDA